MGLGRNTPKEVGVPSSFAKYRALTVDWFTVARATIDMFPNLVLLEIFDLYMDEGHIEGWHTLVHVCREWRIVVFGSPRRLDLRLLCTASTPVREMLDIWPPLPIVVRGNGYAKWGVDNIIAALEHNDRICQLDCLQFECSDSEWEEVLAKMRQPFPRLTHVLLQPEHGQALVDPDSFLGGSAPSLQALKLYRIAFKFPGLPKLLLSVTDLVILDLWEIPQSGYISPEAMVTCLSVLTRLEKLEIGFKFYQSHPDRRSRRPPLTRTLLPVLTKLWFEGVDEYLEELVARIDAPLLNHLIVTFFQALPISGTQQLTQFINRTPKFKALDQARLIFDPHWDSSSCVTLRPQIGGWPRLRVTCCPNDPLSSLTDVCNAFPRALISAVEHLYIFQGAQFEGIESGNSQWLELLHLFTAVKSLYISEQLAPGVAFALQDPGERMAEVLPALQTLFLEDPPSRPVQKVIGKFVAARGLAGYPITVSRWELEEGMLDVSDD